MNFKTTLVAANLGALALFASLSVQAAPITHTIQLIADVPEVDFYVEPVDASWLPVEQRLDWLPLTSDLDKWSKQFDVKHSAGSINAHLDGGLGKLYGGTNVIDLVVKFNGVTLTAVSAPVVAGGAAATNLRTNMEINAVKPATGGFKPAKYTGNVAVVFDAVIVP
ncbi:hypothetical protein BOH74_04160 [Pseudomonas versuta]|uniref:Fimbrial assembly protein n=1 Tax=Pseudomonas versuta TaxID=1788301 RepID=A0A853ZZI0_9PSED|nr:CS1 type fimbrial major subunit [Pseudomonas versuta]OKA28009.1 hypothetical protein BOH74_04160 [Pseudomonas versuta]